MEFKKGDKVKCIEENCDFEVGDLAEVLEIVDKESFRLDSSKQKGRWVYMRFWKLVESCKPKMPTHLVVWEEDEDPCKFFESLEKANEFIKELSENSDVKQDSIVLVEIKTAKKITITKVLRPKEYKI